MKIRHLTYFIMLNFINQRAYFQRISYNFNEVLIVRDDGSITYSGYITYFDHKWDNRKERKRHKLKYNPHEIGGYCLYMLFETLDFLWYRY